MVAGHAELLRDRSDNETRVEAATMILDGVDRLSTAIDLLWEEASDANGARSEASGRSSDWELKPER